MAKKKTSADYWREREDKATEQYQRNEAELKRRLDRIHDRTRENIQKEIDSELARYAGKEEISIAEARKRVDAMDVAAFAEKAKRYVQEKNFTDQANQELRLYNLTMRMSRLELLKAKVGLENIACADEMEKELRKALGDRAYQEFRRQAGILGKTVDYNDPKVTEAIVNASYMGATFSQRIWTRQKQMKHDLDKLVTKSLMQGKGTVEVARELRKTFDVKKYEAERLMRTELARVRMSAQESTMKSNGFDEYVYMADANACPICRALDDTHYKLSDKKPGENFPPLHPNCYCTIAPYVDEEEYEDWLQMLGDKGTTEEWEIVKELKRLTAEWADQLPPELLDSVQKYTHSDKPRGAAMDMFRLLNQALRTGKFDELDPKLKQHAEYISLAIARQSMPMRVTVHRGVSLAEFENILKRGQSGEGFTIEQYMSTTVLRRVAYPQNKEGYYFEIRVPKGARAAYLQEVSLVKSDYEVLIDKGVKYRIVKIDGKKLFLEVLLDG